MDFYTVQFGDEKIETIVTSSTTVVDLCISKICQIYKVEMCDLIIGLDIKEKNHRADTIQLCVSHSCFIFKLVQADYISNTPDKFLGFPGFTFVGDVVERDAHRLLEDWNLQVGCTMDLAKAAAVVYGDDSYRRLGWNDLANKLIDDSVELEMPKEVNSKKLSDEQIMHDAIYASVSFEIGFSLTKKNPQGGTIVNNTDSKYSPDVSLTSSGHNKPADFCCKTALVCWKLPPEDCVKLNVDGSCRGKCGGAGGVIRGRDGIWISGFVVNLGISNSILAELWGIFYGLVLAHSLNLPLVIIESDSKLAVHWVNSGVDNKHPYFELIKNCQNLLSMSKGYSISYIYRQGNSVADCLAYLSHGFPCGFHSLCNAPSEALTSLYLDFRGYTIFHVILSHSWCIHK